jgi:hypothetical protein
VVQEQVLAMEERVKADIERLEVLKLVHSVTDTTEAAVDHIVGRKSRQSSIEKEGATWDSMPTNDIESAVAAALGLDGQENSVIEPTESIPQSSRQSVRTQSFHSFEDQPPMDDYNRQDDDDELISLNSWKFLDEQDCKHDDNNATLTIDSIRNYENLFLRRFVSTQVRTLSYY